MGQPTLQTIERLCIASAAQILILITPPVRFAKPKLP